MSNQNPLATACTLIALLIPWQATAAQKQLDAHEHGSAMLNLAIDNNLVILEFESPAINIVGFEHPPENDQQTQAIKQTITRLETFGDIFSLPKAAQCNPQSASADWVSDSHEEHEEHAEHKEHEEHEEQGGHSEFTAEYKLSCQHIDKLDAINVKLFEHFPGIEDLDVQGITATGQFAAELNADQHRLELK